MYYLQSRYYDAEIGRFVNGDEATYLGTSKNIASYNFFAYCENDSINYTDGSGCAKNIISGSRYSSKYKANYYPLYAQGHYKLTCFIDDIKVFAQYENGFIKVWNAQINIAEIFKGRTKIFSHVLLEIVGKFASGSLGGRTIEGIAYEMICHYIWYKKRILISHTEVCDCGAVKGEIGLDKNAKIFEAHKSKLKEVEKAVKKQRLTSALLKISSTLAKLGWQKANNR